MKAKLSLMLLGVVLCCMQGHAQSSSDKDDFEAFRKSIKEDFEDFRQKINREYLEFLQNPWELHEEEAPVEIPKDDLQPPVIYDPLEPKPDPIEQPVVPKIDVVIAPPAPAPQPQPIAPIEEEVSPVEHAFSFMYYGTEMKVRLDDSQRFSIGYLTERNIAKAMKKLMDASYDNLIIDCLALRDEHGLNDWCYLKMLDMLCSKFCGEGTNEAELLLGYLYLQSGYRMRFAYRQDKLYMLYACQQLIFCQNSFTLDGHNFYSLRELPAQINISQAKFPEEQSLSLVLRQEPAIAEKLSQPRTVKSDRYKDIELITQVNENLLKLYEQYPTARMNDSDVSRWAMYANVPMSHNVRATAYPHLKEKLKGKTPLEAANCLLNLVQTGFIYEFDDKVWGGDRAFFSEETLYYPYCDCEDRSILFTRLVRDLLGLECLLVYYPGHLATAVRFPETTTGDHIQFEGKVYTIADPTYIGAPVGMTMTGMSNATASVIVLE